jgi:hypothetical protein
MATTLQSKYGTEKQSITITIASLTNTSVRGSLVVDNTTNLFLDALVQVQIKSGAASTSATGFVNIYAYGTVDAADSLYPEGSTGTDQSITLTSPTNARLIGTLNMVANAVTYVSEPMSVAAAFGGVLPEKWGIFVENQSGGTFDGTTAFAYYQGIEGQSV